MRSFFFLFPFLYKLIMQDIDDVLLRKHCKEGASVVIYFWVPTKQKKRENTKNIYQKIFEGNPKIIGVRKGC